MPEIRSMHRPVALNRSVTGGLILLCHALLAAAPAHGDPGDAIVPRDGVMRLFNGKNLEGFYTWLKDSKYEDPRQVFRVTDGWLHITGEGFGSLTTKNAYRDYHLVLEFKWGTATHETRKDRAMDSGLLIHSNGEDGVHSGAWMPSIEVQIIQGGCGDFILVGNDKVTTPYSLTVEVGRDRDGEVIWQKGNPRETFNFKNRRRINWFGRDPDWKDGLGFRGRHDVESPDGQWTRMDVLCQGGHIQSYVNGVLVNEAFDVQPQQGKIQLQTELAEIFFRRLELWPLGQGPKPEAAR
jgi:hypothetical protein